MKTDFDILPPEKEGQRYYVIPKFGSGRCYGADTLEQAKEIIQFLHSTDPEYIEIKGAV